MAAFNLTWEQVADELTGARTWAMAAWAVEHEARALGAALRRTGPGGYVKQEKDNLMRRQTDG